MALLTNTEAIDAVNYGVNTPTYLRDDEGNRAFKLTYVATDGWRGYYDCLPVKKWGWEKIEYEGWVTGDWDDAPEEARSSTVEDKLERLARENEANGLKTMAVFTPTSNVFSTSFDVFIKKGE